MQSPANGFFLIKQLKISCRNGSEESYRGMSERFRIPTFVGMVPTFVGMVPTFVGMVPTFVGMNRQISESSRGIIPTFCPALAKTLQ